jgi:argininosuccinate lyase
MDAVASRDFALEALGALSSLGISLSRYAEDLVIWSSQEFGFVDLADEWSTGSSMMPQKKNPDVLELMRGKAGRLIGNYTRFAATLKGVGMTYYKDLQEDKETLFDSLRQMELMLAVFPRVVASLRIDAERTKTALDPSIWATDVADYLVAKGVAFREAHRIVGMVVRHSLAIGIPINELDLSTLKGFSAAFGKDLQTVFSWDQALAHRDIPGGTGPHSIGVQLATARELVG